jgi:hypothetical protein
VRILVGDDCTDRTHRLGDDAVMCGHAAQPGARAIGRRQ